MLWTWFCTVRPLATSRSTSIPRAVNGGVDGAAEVDEFHRPHTESHQPSGTGFWLVSKFYPAGVASIAEFPPIR